MKPVALLLLAAAAMLTGCSSAEKEKEAVVTVETAPAAKQAISQFVSAEAVIFPVKQAIVSPKITSTIVDFKVQRGAHVKQGQLLAILENRDLEAQAEASKGDFEQADATYAITVNAGLPQQIQKAELDAVAAKSGFDTAQRVLDSRKDLYQQGAIPRRDLDSADVALAQTRSQNEQAQKQLADLQRMGKEQMLKGAKGDERIRRGALSRGCGTVKLLRDSQSDWWCRDRPSTLRRRPGYGEPTDTDCHGHFESGGESAHSAD